MSEDIIDEFLEPVDDELVNIINCCLTIISTLSDISDSEYRTYDEELDDMNMIKRFTYRLLYQAQKKISKKMKES